MAEMADTVEEVFGDTLEAQEDEDIKALESTFSPIVSDDEEEEDQEEEGDEDDDDIWDSGPNADGDANV